MQKKTLYNYITHTYHLEKNCVHVFEMKWEQTIVKCYRNYILKQLNIINVETKIKTI